MDAATYARRQSAVRNTTDPLPYFCRMICWERGSEDCMAKMDTCEKRVEHRAETEKDFRPVKCDPPKFAYDYQDSAYHFNGTVG